MAYYIDSAEIFIGDTGAQGDYAINDVFSELNQKMDAKIGQEQFDKSVELIRSDIKSIGDKLENDIHDYKSVTIREMNSCLKTVSENFSNAIGEVRSNLEEHENFVCLCKREQDDFNGYVVNTIRSIHKTFKVIAFIFGLNIISILAIIIHLLMM